ncbi:MAG: hypothetical protein A2639_00530 [Candidatus Staskawiczbacteria bacterium RIFCSPHIGHO2_01_FULL_34_27]|uniref:Uncharacterized protein n=1 Tax=Candidatus Staskawiczbacteria bacterium RIFCSPHIGHO2_01_FULL_34_27 TaxID=1802199 RepID=A0A1G2HJC5_9BACT|nr:hypothetical protein [Candidatus Pacearchaeota archaeon]OGZ62553.1 MAG: hypothetical protein A2639_00530 [Candidatus Staskawiczbacteria bacterium RIFCSPHIGHO2_01_FULL_34_27]
MISKRAVYKLFDEVGYLGKYYCLGNMIVNAADKDYSRLIFMTGMAYAFTWMHSSSKRILEKKAEADRNQLGNLERDLNE